MAKDKAMKGKAKKEFPIKEEKKEGKSKSKGKKC